MLDKTRFAWVREAQIDAAVRRLAAGQFHEISPEEAVSLAHGELPAAPGLRAFVVRGVSLGEAPTFAAVRYSKSLGALQVHQATAHPELYFPGAFTPPPASKRPLIVLLPAAPATVICTVALGGDRVFRGFGGPGMKRFPQPDAR